MVDFDLSLVWPVVERESAAEAALVVASSRAVLCRDSVKLRITRITRVIVLRKARVAD